MPVKKTLKPSNKPNTKYNIATISYSDKLKERASAYSDKTGISIPALFRNGLDLLLKQNNF